MFFRVSDDNEDHPITARTLHKQVTSQGRSTLGGWGLFSVQCSPGSLVCFYSGRIPLVHLTTCLVPHERGDRSRIMWGREGAWKCISVDIFCIVGLSQEGKIGKEGCYEVWSYTHISLQADWHTAPCLSCKDPVIFSPRSYSWTISPRMSK